MNLISKSQAQGKMVSLSKCNLCGQLFYRRDLHSGPAICGNPECRTAWFSCPRTVNKKKDVLNNDDVRQILNNPQRGKIVSYGPYQDVRRSD